MTLKKVVRNFLAVKMEICPEKNVIQKSFRLPPQTQRQVSATAHKVLSFCRLTTSTIWE